MKRAQYRILGRLLRGERLPLSRYRPENPTMHALIVRQHAFPRSETGLIGDAFWQVTVSGETSHAMQKALSPDEVARLYPERGARYPEV